MAAGISMDRFCKDVSIKVTKGVTTCMIRPAGKKDVMATVVGLDFNTPDSFVVDYFNKFGVVLNNNAILSKSEKGPFKGKYNGERKFQVDFSKSSRQMGTYHLIDGNKVRVLYRGNMKTCGRCHNSAKNCPGEAIAKNCAAGGGKQVFLSDHMKILWNEIGFVPTSFSLEEDEKTEDDIQQQSKDDQALSKASFKPSMKTQDPTSRDIELSDGIVIRNFPKALEEKDIHTFLSNHMVSPSIMRMILSK